DVYGWFERVERGVYRLSPRGRRAVEDERPPADRSDEVIVLCVVPAPGHRLDAALEQKIRRLIRAQTSPRHVPHQLFPISEVPVTRSGKPVELSVKAILAGREISNREALANPHVLEEFEQIRQELLRHYVPDSPVSTASR
ncbi:MAG: hypothetical protein EHM35_20955, partial [Planctomycetaceae bacterium]